MATDSKDPEALVVNRTVKVHLRFSLVGPDGTPQQGQLPVNSEALNKVIVEAVAAGGLTEPLRRQHVLLTRAQNEALVPINECSAFGEDDVIIAGYPKSGLTWMQRMVTLLAGAPDDFAHIAEVSPTLPEAGFVGPAFLERINALGRPRSFRTHTREAGLPPANCRVIYLLRQPSDVALSGYHQMSRLGFRGGLDEFVDLFLTGGMPQGLWFEHVEAWWRARERRDILFVWYESMSQDFEASVRRVASFIRTPIDEARLPQIIERCSFKSMRLEGARFDPLHRRPTFADRLFRRGAVGFGARELSAEKLALVETKLQELLGRLDRADPAPDTALWWRS